MLYYLIATLYVLTCLVLLLVVLLQQGKGGDIASGVRRRQQPDGVRRARGRDGADARRPPCCAVLFMIGALALGDHRPARPRRRCVGGAAGARSRRSAPAPAPAGDAAPAATTPQLRTERRQAPAAVARRA